MTLAHRLLLAAGALFLPALFAPLLLSPNLAIAFVCAVAALMLAARGVAFPLALSGVFAVMVAIIGRNPFPNGAIAKVTVAWVGVAILFAILREDDVLPARVLMTGPVVLTVATAAWMIIRLGGSEQQPYGSLKLQLFLAENLAFLIAGIVVARKRKDFRVFLVLALGMAGLSTIVLAHGLATGQAQAYIGGRFAPSSEYNPILFGRDAARAIVIAVFFLLVTRVPWLRLVSVALLPLLAVSFTASGSRGPALGLLLGLLTLFALTLRAPEARRRVSLVFAGGVVGAFLVSQLVPGQNISRSLSFLVGNTQDASSNGRSALWGRAWHAFESHPLFGLGTGGFARVDSVNLYPHNLLLEALVELGVVGGALVVGTIVFGAVSLARTWRTAEPRDQRDAAVVGALLVAALANAMFSGDIATNHAVWLALGLGLGLRLRTDGVPAVAVRLAATRSLRRGPRAPALHPAPVHGGPAGGRPGSGSIISPPPGAVVEGRTQVVVQPARTGRPVEGVRLELRENDRWISVSGQRKSWTSGSFLPIVWRPGQSGVCRIRAVTVDVDGRETATAPVEVTVR